jgi:hypothetical protein
MKNRLPVEFQNSMQVHRTADQSLLAFYIQEAVFDICWQSCYNFVYPKMILHNRSHATTHPPTNYRLYC